MSSGISIPKYETLFSKRSILFWYLPAEDSERDLEKTKREMVQFAAHSQEIRQQCG